jgi:DNA-binding MarR family transcriptional regulator
MDAANMQIEQQMTVLLRRVQRIHLSTSDGDVNLERSAYGIMCKLADEGPQRLGALAATFGLDPSTITRQVQALEEIGLASRSSDPRDRRASILDLTGTGRQVLEQTRSHRRSRLEQALSDWSGQDRADFARLLLEFNLSLDRLLAEQGGGDASGQPQDPVAVPPATDVAPVAAP